MAVDLGRRSGFPFQVKNGFLMDENVFSVSYSAVTCHHGAWMFPFRCFAFSFSYLMLKNRQKGLVLCVVWFLLFCFFLICAVNYCAVHCVSSPVYWDVLLPFLLSWQKAWHLTQLWKRKSTTLLKQPKNTWLRMKGCRRYLLTVFIFLMQKVDSTKQSGHSWLLNFCSFFIPDGKRKNNFLTIRNSEYRIQISGAFY